MLQQLVKKDSDGGGYSNVMPKSWIEAIKDKSTGQTLVEILQGFNMYFLSYNGNTPATRCSVPMILRKKGLWITYVKYDGNVYTEWYNSNNIDDKSWGNSSNWRIGNNELVGDLTISANGNWVINGNETEFKAVGEKGNTPILRVANNRLQVSYDGGDTYNNVSDNPVYTKFRWQSSQNDNVGNIQFSIDDGKTWKNFSNTFVNNLHISRYIGANETLPTSGIAEGTIYAKGPTYAVEDTSNSNPIYRLWVYAWKDNILAWQDNGEFTSIAAGIVQETGNNENAVMSQKATTHKLDTLGSNISELESKLNGVKEIYNGNFGDININVTVGKKITAQAEPSGTTLMLEFKDASGANLNPRKYFYLDSSNNYYNEAIVPDGAFKLSNGSYFSTNLIVNEISATLDSLDKELKSVSVDVSKLNERVPEIEQDIDDIKNLEFITLYDGTFNDINLSVNVGETIIAKATGASNTTLMLEFLDANSGVLSPRKYFYLRDNNNFTAKAIVPEGAVKLGRGSAYDAHLTISKKDAVSLKTLDTRITNLENGSEFNPLIGKKFFYAGDSIGVGQVEDGVLVNWAKLIADNNEMLLTNVSRGGATIRFRDNNTGCIRKMIESISGDYDYIIFQGGVNDGAENVGAFEKPYNDFFDRPLYDESKVYHKGDIVRYGSYLYESKNDMIAPAGAFNKAVWYNHLIQKQYPKLASLDLTKTYSSMEYICKYLMINYPTKKFGFIVTYRGESYDSWNAISDNLVAICEKYGMPYIDLRKCAGFNIIDPELMSVYSKNEDLPQYDKSASYNVDDQVTYSGVKYKALVDIPAPAGDFNPSKWTYIGSMDGWHCNGLGYKQSVSKVEAWMKTL